MTIFDYWQLLRKVEIKNSRDIIKLLSMLGCQDASVYIEVYTISPLLPHHRYRNPSIGERSVQPKCPLLPSVPETALTNERVWSETYWGYISGTVIRELQ